ncbi:MAG TPA: hypothetical protein VL859_02525, partial [Flavobacterium sp.]|nr:hypothetical protein [Flavobacterium sp.]
MLFSHKIIGFIIVFLCYQLSFSQDKPTPKDSSTVLKSILTPPKNKTAKFFHRLVFKPTKSKKIRKKNIATKHLKVEGK